MKRYSLTATYQGRSTTLPVLARNKMTAIVTATIIINRNYSSDKRYDVGEIVLKSPTGQTIMEIKEESQEGENEE